MVKNNRMEQITSHKKITAKHKREKTSLGVAASVALVSTLAITTPAFAAQTTKKADNATDAAIEQASASAPTTPHDSTNAGSKAAHASISEHAQAAAHTTTVAKSSQTPVVAPVATSAQQLQGAGTDAHNEPNSATPPLHQPANTPSKPKDTTNQQVVKPNTDHPEAANQPTANGQVARPENERKMVYNFTVHYAVSGNQTKQLLQPTEFSFTEAKLNEISAQGADGVYIPVPTTKGYRAPRGKYIKNEQGKYVLDTEQNASVQTYIKIDKALIEKYKNDRLSKGDTIVSEFTLEYNPKQVTFYVRHMLQNPNYDPTVTDSSDPRSKRFIEYKDLNHKVKLQDEQGHWHTVCVSKAVGLVGSQVFAQPVNIEGYSPEPNLVGSAIPDDAYYTEADDDEAQTPGSTQTPNKHLVFELRYLLKKHEVSYDVQGGTAIQGHVYKFGEKTLKQNNPTRKGYKFLGWTVKGIKGKESNTPSTDPNFTEQVLPDNDVEFVAHWAPEKEETTYWVNVWVQKARLVKPNDPNSLDNYDYVGRVQRTGKSDQNIENKFTKYDPSFDAPTDVLNGKYRVIKGTLTAEERKQVHFDGLDTTNDRIKADVEKVLESDKEFDRFYKPNYQLENRLNAGEAPEWFGAKEMRPLYKLRPDGTTVLNAVYDRQVYTYYFAKPDGSKKSTDADPYAHPPKPGDPDYKGNARGSSTTVTIGGKKYTYDKDKHDSAYAIKVRFNEELRPGIEFPKTSQITYSPVDRTHDIDGREIDGSKEEPQANMGLYILGDATNMHKGTSDGDNVFDTPPYRFGFEDVYYTREVKGADFYNKKDFFCFSEHYHQGTSTTEVGNYDYNPYQRLFTPFPMDTRQFESNEPSNGPFHVVIRVETPESAAARLKDPHAKPQYKISVMSYTQYNYIFRNGNFSESSLLGWNGFVGPNLIGYKTPSSTSGGDPAIWNNEDEYFFGNSEQKPILDPNASIPEKHMQCVYELLYQDYCAYLKAKGESPVALVGDKEKDKDEKERFKAYVYEKWKDAFDFTYKKNSKGECIQEVVDKEGNLKEVPVKYPFSAILVWTYDRTTPTLHFYSDAATKVTDNNGNAATIQSPFGSNLFKKDYIMGGRIQDGKFTPTIKPYTPAGQAPEQFPGMYSFELNGKEYFIKRPDNLPKDYVFDGWALDANGSQVLIPHMKSDGTPLSAQDILDYVQKQTTQRVLPDGGLTLYAHWVPAQVTHTIKVDMNRGDGSHSEVFVKHGAHAHKAKNDGITRDKNKIPKDEFPLPAERSGYVFYGWEVKTHDADGHEHWLPFAFSTPVVEDLEVRAEWIEDKRVTGTVRQVFLNPGCTIEQYEAAKKTGNQEELNKLIHNIKVEELHDLRPGSSTSVQAGYRDDEYFPDHTYSTFVVNDDTSKNSAEFVYQPYSKRHYTVHYKDAAGNEIAASEPQEGNVSVYTTNKLNYNVVEAKTIPGYVLKHGIAPQYQFVIKPESNGSYKDSYDYTFVYDDVRILNRKDDTQVTPTNYSRLVFKTESTELVVKNKKVISQISKTAGGELKPFAFDPSAPATNVSEIVLDAVQGTKAYQLPLPTPVAKEGFTFVGWTSEDYYDGQKYDGANRLPANSQTFDHKIVYIAHFKKTENAFVGSDPKAETPTGYYKVNYTADQNGRLSRQISDGHGGTKDETLDTLTNIVVLDKYKINVIKAPTPVPDKGFKAIDGFTFEGQDAKDRTYTKHFVMIDPIAIDHRYVLPGAPVLGTNETIMSLIKNAKEYKNEADATTPGAPATYKLFDENGQPVSSLDSTTAGEHKVFIEVTAGREGHRVSKKVPFFYTVMPRAFLQGDLNKYDRAQVAAHYKKYTFKSKTNQGIMTGRETAHQDGEYETLGAYVYVGTAEKPADTYTLDIPSAAGRDFEADGYHYVFRGWKKVDTASAQTGGASGSTAPDVLPAGFTWKNFTPDIGPKDHYKDIKPTDNASYVAMYEKIPYIVTKSEDGTVPPDSVVVSFKPAAGRAWKDGQTGPKVLYIKKGMDISKLDEHGKPIKADDHTTKSILQVLGEKLYGYTGNWTKSSMEGIGLIESMKDGAGANGWKSNNAFQEFVAHQTPYTDPQGGVEKTVIQGTAAPDALEFVKNKDAFVPGDSSTVESITAEYIKVPSTDSAANLTVPIKVTVKYKDSSDSTHTRVYNITGSLQVLGSVLEAKHAPSDPELKKQYKTITFISQKVDAPLKQGQTVADKEQPGQVSGAVENNNQLELQYLAFHKDGNSYTITVPQATGLDFIANGYHYVFTGWKKVQNGAHAQEVLLDASARTLTFDAHSDVVYEAQYKKIPYIMEKSEDGNVPPDSVVVSFKPAAGRAWKDGQTGPKVLYIKKGMDISKLDEHGKPVSDPSKSILAYLGKQLYGYTGDWTKSSMEGIQLIESMKKHGEGISGADEAWKSNNAFQEFVARQTPYTDPQGGVAKTIIQGTAAPSAREFIKNINEFKTDTNSPFESIKAEFVEAPQTNAAANLTVPIKVTVKYKDSSDSTHTRVYNITGSLQVLGAVLKSESAPSDQTLKQQYTTVTFVTKKTNVLDEHGKPTGAQEEPGQLSGANDKGELGYLTFKKTGASYDIAVPKVSGIDYEANGYHYVFTGWKKTSTGSAAAAELSSDTRIIKFDAQENVIYEAQYKKIPYIVTKPENGNVPPDSVVVSFKPAPGRKWHDGSTGPKVLYIKKGMDISRLDEHGRPIPDGDTTTPSILQVLGSQLSAYDNDWTKSSMDGITLIDSMKNSTDPNAWKSNNAFQEFVAHQKKHTEPEPIPDYLAIIQNTKVPAANDFIKNDAALKALVRASGQTIPGSENIDSYTVEFVGNPPQSKVSGVYLVPLKVTIKYHDMAEPKVFKMNSQLKVIYGVLYSKNKPDQNKSPIDYKVFDGNYRKVTFITDDNEKSQHKGTMIGETKNSVDYYVAKDQKLKVRVPKILNQDYKDDGYHYRFLGWRLVKASNEQVADAHKAADGDLVAGTPAAEQLTLAEQTGDLIYKAVYEKVPYVVTKPIDGTVPADSVVVSFKPAPGRMWRDGSTGPKVLYIKKDTDISKLDKDGKPITDPKDSVLAWLGNQLVDYEGDWSKSNMEGITAESSMNAAHATNPAAWLSKDAFQEFVARQKSVVDPSVKKEIVITQYGQVPDAKDFIDNMAAIEKDNIATNNDGSYQISVTYGDKNNSEKPSSSDAAVYTVPLTVTIQHKDMDKPIVYKLTSVLRVMDKVLSNTQGGKIAGEITRKQQTSEPLNGEEQQFKDNYAKVVFSSGTEGTLVGGESDTTATHYVKKNTNITLSVPSVIAKVDQTDTSGDKFKWVFTGWKLQIKPNAQPTPTAHNTGENAEHGVQIAQTRRRRSLSETSLVTDIPNALAAGNSFANTAVDGNPLPLPANIVLSAEDLKPENLTKTLRKLEAIYGKVFSDATYEFVAQYKKQPYILDSSQQDTVPEGYVPLAFLPGPKHTWKDGSTRPYIFYIQSGTDITKHKHELEALLSGFVDWQVYDKNGTLIQDADQINAANNPKHAYTLIAHQTEVPNISAKDDVVIGVYDEVPNYDRLINDIKQGTTVVPGLAAFMNSDRFVGFEAPSTEVPLNPLAGKPGVYVERFGLKYKNDKGDIEVKNIAVNIRVLPRVIPEQHFPAQDTPEAKFIKHNYTKVMYRVALNDHGRLTSPFTTFYVRRGYTIDPNALLYFDKELRSAHTQGNEEIGVPSTQADTGYTFFDWQKLVANDKGDVVYLAHFHKLPIAHFTLESTTEAEQPFTTKLIGDAQNHPRLKANTKVPDGIHVSCEGETCTISGTAHINDWKDGEERRVIELHFEAVDERQADAYGRTSYGLKKDITVRIVVTRPHKTTYPQAPAVYDKPALPKVGTGTPRHARLPQTSDPTLAAHAAGLLGMGVGMITAVALARKKERKQ
ncbi:InlB B-repeat-containing protein [Fannyhessea vaginae]|uniref:InlB B-repeat-containing protein n=1 Tax=Fannyhessea vaginae TaxID=82135 RepID=UPI00336AE2E2